METAIINAGNAANPDRAIADLMKEHSIDLALCSGYMKLIGADSIGALKGRILNIHPALLPLYGGKGMYGPRVHQAVHDNGDRETGITIHLVNNEYDRGRIIAQKRIPIPPASSATEIEEMVKAAEPDFYIETLAGILTGSITLA